MNPRPVTIIIFLVLFAAVTVLGFVAARWRRGDLSDLHEWGLGGRRFGTWVTWFLLGGDLYTAYTFIAVPALMFGAGAAGFFAVPYTILIYPIMFAAFPRLWSVAHRHGYVTAADFVRGRFGHRGLALAVAVTGIVATMPYIALQLLGMQVVIAALGIPTTWVVPGIGALPDMPLLIAFVVLALYTYSSGLRAPALIAVVKDFLIYATVLAAVIVIPSELGGYGKIFAAVPPKSLLLPPAPPGSLGAGFVNLGLSGVGAGVRRLKCRRMIERGGNHRIEALRGRGPCDRGAGEQRREDGRSHRALSGTRCRRARRGGGTPSPPGRSR